LQGKLLCQSVSSISENTDSAFTEFLNTNNLQLNKFTSQIGQIEASNISEKSFHIRGHDANSGAEKFLVHIRHIHVNLATKELHLSFLLSI